MYERTRLYAEFSPILNLIYGNKAKDYKYLYILTRIGMDEDEIDIKETFTEVVKEETNKIYEKI